MDETLFESQLGHQNAMEFLMVLLTLFLSFIISREVLLGNISLGMIIIGLGIIVGVIGVMIIIRTFFHEAPVMIK